MGKPLSAQDRQAKLLAILAETKQLMLTIDDLIPSINLWVSAMGGVQAEPTSFSPSRLLQASMLVNVGDSQFVLAPQQPMQIGPDFTLSLYMLFQGHATTKEGEPYGVEDGQRKPMWQEVIHKSRVRLYRTTPRLLPGEEQSQPNPTTGYAYQLQIIEDMDDGRVHTFEDGNIEPGPYNGVPLAGIRENIPIGQISKMFYADVGRILNINNEDGASSNPVLLLKRNVSQLPTGENNGSEQQDCKEEDHLIESVEELGFDSDATISESSPQDDVDRQLREESLAADLTTPPTPTTPSTPMPTTPWIIPHNLDPEWMALEVFEFDDSDSIASSDVDDHELDEDLAIPQGPSRNQAAGTSVDSNLITQLQRMGLAAENQTPPRPASSQSRASAGEHALSESTELVRQAHFQPTTPLSPTTIERSPFGAIKTSLSLLEMLLRLTSLQEFEQTTHLSIPDHVLKFYLDESASESGLHGKERWAARAEATKKMGFDPYIDGPGGGNRENGGI